MADADALCRVWHTDGKDEREVETMVSYSVGVRSVYMSRMELV
jgi:hypothetical protein